jgi:hypothetical protein
MRVDCALYSACSLSHRLLLTHLYRSPRNEPERDPANRINRSSPARIRTTDRPSKRRATQQSWAVGYVPTYEAPQLFQ